ncbi:hypothetical protein Hypma_006634 [Hypsizygus marmoreus]|uniref:Uncharacterized protein n=1 Tax=Hypsizygus marmoreus TaxID=39966 RepID=A0A369JVF2_HYPMA|nr:hypothetical protein Hypma_006634 [Hypsizygus marmoreus]
MSALVNSRSALRYMSASARRASTSRLLTTRRPMSTMHDNDPDLLEAEKRRNLSGQQHKTSTPLSDAPGWNETLASESEADVKADRTPPIPTEDLQAQTIEYVAGRYAPDERKEESQEVYETTVKKVHKKTTTVVDDGVPPSGYA